MPLLKGKSKAAFGHNVKTEMDSGKPQGQALAIAYNMKRKKKMASGGTVQSGDTTMNYAEGGQVTADNYQSQCTEHCNYPCEVHPQAEYDSAEYNKMHGMHHNSMAMSEDERMLNQHGEMEEGPQGPWMAEGGMMTDSGYQDEDHDMDMVGRIMKQRQMMYSKGGKVANQDSIEAGFSPNEFDDLHLRDDLESSYTGANSGDELGNAGEDERRRDIVSRIMASRRKRPAKVS